ncbi:MAG: DNA-binding domain-containing protein [Coxiellaceae bacterium]|nr:DNA-binding domain-containing protein [Coxiellaceae bacterium]
MLLKKLQQHFQSYLLKSDDGITSFIADTKHLSVQSRLQIYQNSYYERIITALSQDYPVLKMAIGDNAFSSLVIDYVKTHPSINFNLRTVGKYLSDFILSKNPDFLMYADLAKLEWFLSEVEIDHNKKQFKTIYNVFSVWKNYQENKFVIDFELLPVSEELVILWRLDASTGVMSVYRKHK